MGNQAARHRDVSALPKAHLHLHFTGSMRHATLLELAGRDGIVLPDRTSDWVSLLYMALIPGALGIVGQTWAQAHLPPTRTAIVMSMEPVFAALFAVLLGGESLSSRMLLGGAFVLVAMLVVELGLSGARLVA